MFHYPPNPKDYDFQPTPFDIDNDLIDTDDDFTDDTDASSSSSDEDDTHRSFKSKIRDSNDSNYVSGQTLLDLLDEQDKKKRAKYRKRIHQKLKKPSISSRAGSYGGESIYTSNSLHNPEHVKVGDSLGKVFGFESEFLAETISPTAPQLCNTKFELSVDDMTFLGLPIRVNEDGLWRNNKGGKKAKSKHSGNASTRSRKTSSVQNDELPLESDQGADGDAEYESETEEKPVEEENFMHMFHVVFVMNPPVVEYNYRVDEMFHFVVSRLSLVLRYEQSKSNYVWNESKLILKVKEENPNLSTADLYEEITNASSLANTLKDCYNSISTSNIANLEINNKIVSLQIPLKNQFKSLLPKTTPVLPGSYLSSIIIDHEESDDLSESIDAEMGHLSVLLLDVPSKIIEDLKTQNSPLALLIEKIHPMTPLKTLAQNDSLELGQIKSFVKYLIYWRRARIIIPLHTKSIFIVSPMAPLSNISSDLLSFKNDFPSLPSLPSFLSLLSSSKPRQYSSIIPSKDHKEVYLDALTWLIRHGYVTQLLTFVWLKIPQRIKIAVDEDLEKEGLTKRKATEINKISDITTDNTSKAIAEGEETLKDSYKKDHHKTTPLTLTSTDELIIKEEEEEETIILDPERATAVERRWIAKVIKGQPNDVVVLFHKLLKYFNGKSPLELVIIKENISRQELKKLLHAISANITSVKHW